MATKMLPRYNDGERMNHWFIALMFVLAGLSGLAFFHPSLFFLSHLFGGGSWARILHPFMGVLMVLAFALLFAKLWRHNTITDADREWKKHMGDMLRGNKAAMPPVGRYNYGQKASCSGGRGSRLTSPSTCCAWLRSCTRWRRWC
jgi:formate dehydrogenase subunit gamma